MFRKIVSNLPFSPALIGQLGFYAKRLRKEEATRRLGLIFVILALVVQSLVVFQPSESANASGDTDMVSGGISSIDDYLASYDTNTKHLRDVMNYVGITREEIASTEYTSLTVNDSISWGFASRFSYDQGERQYGISDLAGNQVSTFYSRPLKLWGSPDDVYYGWVGHSEEMGWFGILQSCGNLVTRTIPTIPTPPNKPKEVQTPPRVSKTSETTPKASEKPEVPKAPEKCAVNPNLLANDENCLACPGNETLWIDDSICIPDIIKSKKATNLSQGFVDASSVKASSGDRIRYTITIKNIGLNSESIELKEQLSDVLEYSTLINSGGGTLNETTKVLSWSDITLDPKDKQTRTFIVKVLDTIPATARGTSDPTSYDCVMANIFGNYIDIEVDCPTPKVVERVASELPKTGTNENIIFACATLAIAAYFYARTRQLEKEVRLIRKDTSMGTI